MCCEWTGATWRPSKHAAQLAPLQAVELIDSSSRSAIQRSCHAETSISIVSGVALCYCAFMDSRGSRRVTTLLYALSASLADTAEGSSRVMSVENQVLCVIVR